MKTPWTWRRSVAVTALALWVPAIVGIALDERMRRIWRDAWFWPGLVPARYFGDVFYEPTFVWATALALVQWTVATRWRWWFGVAGALIQGLVSLGYLKVVLTM